MELAVLGDTHVPSRAPALPEWVVDRIRAADHVVHTGDVDAPATLSRLEDLAGGDLTVVSGNMDGGRLALPDVATLEAGGVEFVVTHGTGNRRGYERRVAGAVRERGGPDVVGIAGHTHEPLDREVGGVRLLNPGSATGCRPATEATMMTAVAGNGSLEVQLHRG